MATALVLVLTLATASAGEALSPQAIAEAEWARDVEALLAGPYEVDELPRAAIALGRTRDPAVLDRLRLFAEDVDLELRRAATTALGWVPGAAPWLRARLDAEVDPVLRALLLRGLGQQGAAADVGPLSVALARPYPEGAAAAEALGLLARRGVDVGPAVPALIAALASPDGRQLQAVAFAVYRVAPRALSPADVDAVDRALDRASDESTRAWLLPTLLAHLPPAQVRARQLEVLAEPFRAPKVALVAGAEPLPELDLLVADPDPWVALAARQRLRKPSEPPRAEAWAAALGGATPKARADAASALLPGASVDELARLGAAGDPVVRELAVAALAERDEPEAFARLQGLFRAEGEPEALLPALDGLLRGVRAGRKIDPATAIRLRALAVDGPFLVRRRAHEVARAAGLVLGPLVPVQPGPADLDRALDHVAQVRSARVRTTEGELRITLDPDTAPLAVATFAWLAEHGALDGRPFHRVVPAFVVQTGDPRGDGHGGPGWYLPDELSALPFVAGAVGMATSGPDTGGSQWFVTTTPQPHLAGSYTRFGVVSDGLDLVRRLDTDDVVLQVTIERVGGPR